MDKHHVKVALTSRMFDNDVNVLLGRLVGKDLANFFYRKKLLHAFHLVILEHQILQCISVIGRNVDPPQRKLFSSNVVKLRVVFFFDQLLEVTNSLALVDFDRECICRGLAVNEAEEAPFLCNSFLM